MRLNKLTALLFVFLLFFVVSCSQEKKDSTLPPEPTPQGVAAPVGQAYSFSDPVQTGFAKPWNVFNSNHMIVDVYIYNNTAPKTIRITANQSTGGVVYRQGYILGRDTTNGNLVWRPFTFPQSTIIGTNWIDQNAAINYTLTTAQYGASYDFNNKDVYVLSYTCSKSGSDWKCGCENSATCTNLGKWQIQSFKLDESSRSITCSTDATCGPRQACLSGMCQIDIGVVPLSGAVCGNSILETGEQCDDDNTVSGDGCSATCTIEGIVPTFFCTGFDPANSTICTNDNQTLTINVSKDLVTTCTSVKCEYTCNSGFTYNSVNDRCEVAPITYSCTGTTPSNAQLCTGDNTGLTANTVKTVVTTCTSGTKCEYLVDCLSDSDCPSGTVPPQYCPLSGVSINFCTVKLSAYGFCSSDSQCLSNDCTLDGICAKSSVTGFCMLASLDCPSDTACSANICTPNIPTTYSCTGTIPTNAQLCTGDSTSLTADTTNSVVTTCGTPKCEYTCNPNYVKSVNSCVSETPGSCTTKDDCNGGELCESGSCVAGHGAGTFCTSTDLCGRDYSCLLFRQVCTVIPGTPSAP